VPGHLLGLPACPWLILQHSITILSEMDVGMAPHDLSAGSVSNGGSSQADIPPSNGPKAQSSKSAASVYDVVAGRVGLNGFLNPQQLESSNLIPLAPEDVLLRRIGIAGNISDNSYDAASQLSPEQQLPESDLLKAIHAYVSYFYRSATQDNGRYDFRSLDETALLAIGILLEEAGREILGECGDMTLVEPEGLENGLEETKMTRYQIQGTVKPPPGPDYASETSELEEMQTKKQKR